MKKLILCAIFVLTVFKLYSQEEIFVKVDSASAAKKAKEALNSMISQADIIVETQMIGRTGDYYYIENDNQSYCRTMMKVIRVIRGVNIGIGDTIVSIWKLESKGDVTQFRTDANESREPVLWFSKGSISCMFLTNSEFPTEPVSDAWSRFKHTTYISSSNGYFATRYDMTGFYIKNHAMVSVPGLTFKYLNEWYNYLRTFPNINLPKN